MTSASCVDGLVSLKKKQRTEMIKIWYNLFSYRAGSINVYLGAHNIVAPELQRVMYTSTVYIKHPRWNSVTKDGDLALVKLPNAINFNCNSFYQFFKIYF